MDRRTFLKSSGAATVGGLAAAATTASAQGFQEHDTSLAGTKLHDRATVLTIAETSEPQPPHLELALRRLAEKMERATDNTIQLAASLEADNADITLISATNRLQAHPAYAALVPLLHGMSTTDYTGWMTTGGGAPLLEQLEAETSERILLLTHAPEPTGLWADRDLFGLHQRPSVTVSANGRLLTATQDIGSGTLPLNLSYGLLEDLQSGRFDSHVLHALPIPLSGEPFALTMPTQRWQELSSSQQQMFTSFAAEEIAQSIVEAHATTQMARTASALPAPVILPNEFKHALAAAIEETRTDASAQSELAAQLFASQAGYRTITGSKDLAKAARNTASLV